MNRYILLLLSILILTSSVMVAQNGETPESNYIDYKLLLIVFGFGAAIIIGELLLIKMMSARWAPYSVIRLVGITLIIISALVLVIGSQDQNQISAVIGLLGTIAGYLLGKSSKVTDIIEPDKDGK